MNEISGIIRNGIERGWPREEIRSSLINSGYPIQEIDYEFSKILNVQQVVPYQLEQPQPTQLTQPQVSPIVQQSQQIMQPPAPIIPQANQTTFNPQDLTNYQTPVQPKKKKSNWVIITLVVLLVLCILAGAGVYFFG